MDTTEQEQDLLVNGVGDQAMINAFKGMNRKAKRRMFKEISSRAYKRSKKSLNYHHKKAPAGSDLMLNLIQRFLKDNPIREETLATRRKVNHPNKEDALALEKELDSQN